jgi:murein DD-endopeptidase MepM/ murein hydrolase activator NlpD
LQWRRWAAVWGGKESARPFLHAGLIGVVFLAVTFGPVLFDRKRDEGGQAGGIATLNTAAFAYDQGLTTQQSGDAQRYRGGEVIIHRVGEGETLSSIAKTYGLTNIQTIAWENGLDKNTKLKQGQELKILPVDGVRHKVARGETIFTIAKKYGLDESEAQQIVDYPFNEFKNDETFELTVGQYVMIPNGVKPPDPADTNALPVTRYAAQLTPNAGAVTAAGTFVWPAAGRITQGYSAYHHAIDIANRDGGPILAADSGKVVVAGWIDNTGYGNRVMIDHGNGFVTLYGHMSVIQVQVGQTVQRGNVIGQMGSTGRSTGTHLHFEIRRGGVGENPMNYLK